MIFGVLLILGSMTCFTDIPPMVRLYIFSFNEPSYCSNNFNYILTQCFGNRSVIAILGYDEVEYYILNIRKGMISIDKIKLCCHSFIVDKVFFEEMMEKTIWFPPAH